MILRPALRPPLRDPMRAATALKEGGGAFSPINLGASALAWWSADQLSSLTLNSNKVITWTDRIAGIAPTNGTDANRPTYSATSYDGSPGLSFNGTSQYLTIASQPLPSGANPCEIWCVVQQDALVADATTRRAFAYGGTSNNDSRQVTRVVNTGNLRADTLIGSGAAASSTSLPGVNFSGRHVVRLTVTGTKATVYVDGLPGTELTVTPATGTTRITIGAVLTGTGLWSGQIRDIVVTSTLTDQQQFQMWQWALDQSHIGRSAMNSWIQLNGDSFSTVVSGDGMFTRFTADARVSAAYGVGGQTLAQGVADVLARPWWRNSVLIFWDGSSNGYGTLAADMALYAQVAAAVPKSIIIPPVRRRVDASDILTAESALQTALASAYAGRTIDAHALLMAAATSPGDDADVTDNVVPRSLLIDHVSNAHLNTAGWNVIYPAITSLMTSLGY